MGWRCALGCETLLNYSHTCPNTMDSMCPDTYQLIKGGESQCLDLCRNYAYDYTGNWIHYSHFDTYFSCFRSYQSHCDYWEIYRNCSPFEEIPIYCMQLISLICSLVMLFCLRREIRKGLLQQAWFMINVHSMFQGLFSEQGHIIWRMSGLVRFIWTEKVYAMSFFRVLSAQWGFWSFATLTCGWEFWGLLAGLQLPAWPCFDGLKALTGSPANA